MRQLYKQLQEYSKQNMYPFHMPGHKRNTELLCMDNPYGLDITEIHNFDNLQDPSGVLRKSMEQTAELYGVLHTHYLVNGSTVGLLAAIGACTNRGDRILMARNCHKSVYNAVYLNELRPIYVYPQINWDYGIHSGISPENIRELLIKYPDVKLVIITSPTYEGVVSDIQSIADIVHERKIPFIVDEAHGAHFGFHQAFPDHSMKKGADIVIQSVHKTMPAFTQTALLHNNGDYVSDRLITQYINMYQSTSPSYLLMSSIDRCMNLIREQGKTLFDEYYERLEWFYEQANKLQHLHVLCRKDIEPYEFDISKLVISTLNTNITGEMFHSMLRDNYHIELEMEADHYVIAMTSICDTWEGMNRLWNGIKEIDQTLMSRYKRQSQIGYCVPLEQAMTHYEASKQLMEYIELENSNHRICGDMIYVYPPGIPLIVPGEYINKTIIDLIKEFIHCGLEIKGLVNKEKWYIPVTQEVERK